MTSTRSALEARDLATAADGAFDAVITDLRMPDLDGLALAAAIRSTRGSEAPPVIVLSSLGQRDRDAEATAAFLTKPVKPAALREVLVQVLSGSVVQAAPRPPDRCDDRPDDERAAPVIRCGSLAEDNAVNQKLAIRLLQRMGYTTDVAADGLAAIAALEAQDYDVVLMDVQMPELDGLEATRRIRARWPDRPLRIVAMTANAMEGDRETCLAAGMDDYVSKPIRPDELAAAPDRAHHRPREGAAAT